VIDKKWFLVEGEKEKTRIPHKSPLLKIVDPLRGRFSSPAPQEKKPSCKAAFSEKNCRASLACWPAPHGGKMPFVVAQHLHATALESLGA